MQQDIAPIYRGEKESAAYLMLRPLLSGGTVALNVNDPSMRKKKRMEETVLILSIPKVGYLLASMPGYGSELEAIKDVKPMMFYRLGISMKMSKVLSKEINKLFIAAHTGGSNGYTKKEQ